MLVQFARLFVALWFLGGSPLHVYLAINDSQTYRAFGDTMLLPFARDLWQTLVMPNITFFVLALAAFELTVGLLLLSRGRLMRLGLLASVAFNSYLVFQGLGVPQAEPFADFMLNRLANLLLIAIQLPLLRVDFARTFPEVLATGLRKAFAS